MSAESASTTTLHAIKRISAEQSINEDIVRIIVDAFTDIIKDCLKSESPFTLAGFGKFYHNYRNNTYMKNRFPKADYYSDKVHKEVVFRLTEVARTELNGWVHDLNIKNNLPTELSRVAIRPNEIEKIRRHKILDDQQQLGFRSDLLFDKENLPQSDSKSIDALGKAPTVDDIIKRIGLNLGSD